MNDFFMDEGLNGGNSIDEAIKLRAEMQELFELGGSVLRKWKSSELTVLTQIPHELEDCQSNHSLDIDHYNKVLGM